MTLALTLQNQALYMTTLHNRKEGWKRIKFHTKKMIDIASALVNNGTMSETDKNITAAALHCLEFEYLELERIHGDD